MRSSLIALSVAALAVGLGSCGGGTDANNATITTSGYSSVLGNDFTGNYVKIHGVRSVPADGKYPCLNEFDVCLGLDPAGATASIKDLCPSNDTPEGTWNITYIIYADPQCSTALANLGCVPDMQEWLNPGHNRDEVTCITRNADKSWDFCVMDPVTGAGSEACMHHCDGVTGDPTCLP